MKARLRRWIANPITLNIKSRFDSLARRTLGRRAAVSVKAISEAGTVKIRDGAYWYGGSEELHGVERITQHLNANDQLIYFTSSSLTADDRHLIFLSDVTGHPNLFVRDLETGEESQLSDNRHGLLKSYAYFHGTPYHGLSKASPCVHDESGTVYYIQGREIYKSVADGKRSMLAELPEGQMTAYTHVSADGKSLCVPTVDERALDGKKQLRKRPDYDIDERVRKEKLHSYLRVYDAETGKERMCEPVPQAWVTHVQFSPINSDVILYNHEWASQSGVRRMWLWDGNRHIQLRAEGDGRDGDDWACHEIWSTDGFTILYHGKYVNGRHFIGRLSPSDGEIIELPLPRSWKHYGHYSRIGASTLITDGYFRTPRPNLTLNCPWLCRVEVDWLRREMTWTPLAAHLSSWESQDAHPHPMVDHAAKYVYFTSDMNGKLAVYRVGLNWEA